MRYYEVWAYAPGRPAQKRPKIKAKNLIEARKIAKKKYPNKIVHVLVPYTGR